MRCVRVDVKFLGCALVLGLAGPASVGALEHWPGETPPHCVAMDRARLGEIDSVVREAIDEKKCPGAVVLVSRFGHVVWWRSSGYRVAEQTGHAEPMSRETVFDMASLTKVMATATSVMILVDRGQVALGDRVTRFIPEFGQNGKESVTVEQLLRHRGGFIADNALDDYRSGPVEALDRIWKLKPVYEPDSKFLYTDVGYIVLGEIVRRVSGMPLDEFARENIFEPLGMCDTSFRPDHFQRVRTAPTERREGEWMRGDVHDPRAYLLGGVAGHAGLFSTAADVHRYAQMILNEGVWCGRRVLSPAAVAAMTSAGSTPANQRRGLGWDIDTPFSTIRGDLFPVGGFGHTGFTGTSLWIDPSSRTAVIVLTNRVHPDGRGDVRQLRRKVATIVASAFQVDANAQAREPLHHPVAFTSAVQPEAAGTSPVHCGIDVLVRDRFQRLRGRKIGLITNHTGLDREGRATIDLLHGAEGVKLVALFSPEHGIRGLVDAAVSDSVDEKTGLPIYSLYDRNRRKPTAEQLRGIDTLVFDIQDIGCRFYTYSATLGLAMEAAAEHRLKFVMLDRPNPIGGELVEGPVLDAGRESFTAYHRIPVRHGMTLGELARMYQRERKIEVDLDVVGCEGWRRGDYLESTGLVWTNPSPNMRSLRQAVLYPGIGLLETTNVSVGRGTDTPFEVLGAPWIDGRLLAAALATEELDGVVFVPVQFQPASSKHAGVMCGGVQIIVTDRETFRAVPTGLAIARRLRLLFAEHWDVDKFITLLGHKGTFEGVKAGKPLGEIMAGYADELREFERRRKSFLMYE